MEHDLLRGRDHVERRLIEALLPGDHRLAALAKTVDGLPYLPERRPAGIVAVPYHVALDEEPGDALILGCPVDGGHHFTERLAALRPLLERGVEDVGKLLPGLPVRNGYLQIEREQRLLLHPWHDLLGTDEPPRERAGTGC